MIPVVLFPDIEFLLVGYLRGKLGERQESYCEDVTVDITEPIPRPGRSIVVRRDGGPRLDLVRELARVTFNVWAESDEVVTDLTAMARALVVASPADGAPIVKAAENSGPTSIADVQPHRLFVVDFTVRGEAA